MLESILDHEFLLRLWRDGREMGWLLVANFGRLGAHRARILLAWRVGERSGTVVIEGSLAAEIPSAQLRLPQLLEFKLPLELFSFNFKFANVLGELAVLKRSTQSLEHQLSCLAETWYTVDLFAKILLSLSVVVLQFRS